MTYFLKCVLIEDYHGSETGSSKWNNCLNCLPVESLPGKKNTGTSSQVGRCLNFYCITTTKMCFAVLGIFLFYFAFSKVWVTC